MEGPLALSDTDYFAKDSAEEVEIECDIEFLPETDQEEVPMARYKKRKSDDDEVGSSSSQLKRRRLSTIVEDPDFRLEGEPVYKEVAQYEETSEMFIKNGQKMDLISLIRKLSEQEDFPLDQEEESRPDTLDANSNDLIEKLRRSSPYFLQHKESVRVCSLGTAKEFDKTDPSLPEGFRVRENVRGDGKRVDKEFLNQKGTLIFRSKRAVLAYVEILNEDTLEEEDDQAVLKTLSRKKIPMLTKAVHPISTITDLSPVPSLQSSNPQLNCIPRLVDREENFKRELQKRLDKTRTKNLKTSDSDAQEEDELLEEEEDQAVLKTLSRKKIPKLTKAVHPISTITDLSPEPSPQSSNPQLNCIPRLVDREENFKRELQKRLDTTRTKNLRTSDSDAQEEDQFLEEEEDQAVLKTLSRKKTPKLTEAFHPISSIEDLSPVPFWQTRAFKTRAFNREGVRLLGLQCPVPLLQSSNSTGTGNLRTSDSDAKEEDELLEEEEDQAVLKTLSRKKTPKLTKAFHPISSIEDLSPIPPLKSSNNTGTGNMRTSDA
eukprot:GFUD01043340.1.p1 GENE.GFUD01043340.1~~GFUD01043340.1.p1  ORF type:complete len:546 (+),score=166.47 GFUD01043340.1:43-1680(+)